jgi:hypothetical protein
MHGRKCHQMVRTGLVDQLRAPSLINNRSEVYAPPEIDPIVESDHPSCQSHHDSSKSAGQCLPMEVLHKITITLLASKSTQNQHPDGLDKADGRGSSKPTG